MLDERIHLVMLQRFYLSDSAGKCIVPNLDEFIVNPEQGNAQLKK